MKQNPNNQIFQIVLEMHQKWFSTEKKSWNKKKFYYLKFMVFLHYFVFMYRSFLFQRFTLFFQLQELSFEFLLGINILFLLSFQLQMLFSGEAT